MNCQTEKFSEDKTFIMSKSALSENLHGQWKIRKFDFETGKNCGEFLLLP
ncbi:uncharacterized protein METZ01_LOCUS373968 [marine metagenome]|uniref:Uncharacterized protein n=1 Tax=marine metagenome TaxID=408172 RepID=A0A382TG71_9ZZZZ